VNNSTCLSFAKLEALANDFVLIDARSRPFQADPLLVQRLADRRRGIGFDQLLILRQASNANALCAVEIRNSDGSRAEQCGNGMRAIALWLHQTGAYSDLASLESDGGPVEIQYQSEAQITATLQAPDFEPATWGGRVEQPQWQESINGRDHLAFGVSMGNPHLVLEWLEAPSPQALLEAGQHFQTDPRLAFGANIGLAHVAARHHIDLAVHERGVGPTQACGSGACAAAVVLIMHDRVDSPVTVSQPGGELVIHWIGPGHRVRMTGPARHVFDGSIRIDTLFESDQPT
jgi:diaminopimelate epimerase